jgi:hypothetical protein
MTIVHILVVSHNKNIFTILRKVLYLGLCLTHDMADFVKYASYSTMISLQILACQLHFFCRRMDFYCVKLIFVTTVFIKVEHFYTKICSKLVGHKKSHFTEYFVTPAIIKITFHCITWEFKQFYCTSNAVKTSLIQLFPVLYNKTSIIR